MIATVEDGRLVALRPDKEHPLSAGFACQKGIAFTEVQNDTDRVTTPLRRTSQGFEPVGWDEAMGDIADRLAAVHKKHGSGAIGWYFGNPGAFSYSHTLSLSMFMAGLGPRLHVFTAGSQDVNNRFVASQLLYGSPLALPIPDVLRTDLLVVIGANPIVSHGSALTVPRIKDRMHDIVKRGGRVLVIDPRKTETAAQFEWLGIIPDGDAYLLLSLLHVLFGESLVDRARLARQANGAVWLERLARSFSPEATQPHTGIDPDIVRSLARDLAAKRSAVYGRVGTSVGQNGTLTTYLLDAVNLVAGNLDAAGGSMFGRFGLPGERWLMKGLGAVMRTIYTRRRSRIGGFPSVLMSEPAGVMAKEITTPGKGQVRALLVSAGNPVLSVPNGDELEDALETLELTVGIDFYVNETLAHCDYVLPAATMYEHDDFPLAFQTLQPTPFRQATEAVIAPAGQARAEWEIIDELTRRLWHRTPGLAALAAARKALSLFGIRLTPRLLVDAVIRLGDGGDRYGLRRGGLTFSRLVAEHPHGAVLAANLRAGVLKDTVVYRGGRVRLVHDEIAAEVAALSRRSAPDGYPLRLIGMREARSENSWMHNAPLLMRGERRHRALMHADDAADLHITDGESVRVTSQHGEIELPVALTKDIVPGVIAIPHGWGHKGTGGWRVANGAGGANVNRLMSSAPEDLESLAGMAHLTGVPVRVGPVRIP
jgi:anaerobic selenocysteine-containing dehydrogenase